MLDVNRDFQPWLVERSRLFSAMDTLDSDKKRGLLLIEWLGRGLASNLRSITRS